MDGVNKWIPIGEPDIPTLSLDAQKVFRLIQFTTKTHYQLIRKVTRLGDERITEAIYEIRKMEAIRMGKLTNQQRAAIYAAHKDGTPQKDLAKQYGVSIPAISQLITKLSKAEQEIMQPAAEDKPKPGIINPEFDAAVNEMIAESKSADAEKPSANAEPEKLPGVVRRALEAGYAHLVDEIAERRERIEDLQAEIAEFEKDIAALKKWVEGKT